MSFELPAGEDKELVFTFFCWFARFECALKRANYVRGENGKRVSPDWDKFARDMRGKFAGSSDEAFRAAVEELKKLEPRVQILEGNRLEWETRKKRRDECEEQYVIRLLRTARNNLFHGGKYVSGPFEELARDRAILRAAVNVLKGCCELNHDLQQWIDEAA
jgi:hypothetical protein